MKIEPSNKARLIVRREFLAREFLAAMILTIVLLALALAVPASYTLEPENPATGSIRAPWLILWLQVLLRWFSPILAGIVIPLAAFSIVAFLPWLPQPEHDLSKHSYRFGLPQAILLALCCALAALTFWGL